MRQCCGFNPWSGRVQESTSECISKWNNRCFSLSLKLIMKTGSGKVLKQFLNDPPLPRTLGFVMLHTKIAGTSIMEKYPNL